MPSPIDLSTYNSETLEVIGPSNKNQFGKRWWRVRCKLCGRETEYSASAIKRGDKKSCGCLRVERQATLQELLSKTDYPDIITRDGIQFFSLRKMVQHSGKTKSWLINRAVELGMIVERVNPWRKVSYFNCEKTDALLKIPAPLTAAELALQPQIIDRIFIEDAAEYVGYSGSKLKELVKNKTLRSELIPVTDVLGRVQQRTAFFKSELNALFVHQPEPGQPIRLPNGEEWWLRKDAMTHFQCSNIVFYTYAQKPSLQHAGVALRRRNFYLMGQPNRRGKGKSGKVTAWNGEDLVNIDKGLENEIPNRNKGSFGRRTMKEKRRKAEAFIRQLKPQMPMPASEGLNRARQAGFLPYLVYPALKAAGIETEPVCQGFGRTVFYWRRSDQSKAQVEAVHNRTRTTKADFTEARPAATNAATGMEPKTNRGGRPTKELTQEVNEFCFNSYVQNKKLAHIRSKAEQLFGKAAAPKYDSHVITCAQRFAKKNNKVEEMAAAKARRSGRATKTP